MPYPDNMPSSRRTTADYCCLNDECETRFWSVRGTQDLGDFTPDDEDDTKCPECGTEGK